MVFPCLIRKATVKLCTWGLLVISTQFLVFRKNIEKEIFKFFNLLNIEHLKIPLTRRVAATYPTRKEVYVINFHTFSCVGPNFYPYSRTNAKYHNVSRNSSLAAFSWATTSASLPHTRCCSCSCKWAKSQAASGFSSSLNSR